MERSKKRIWKDKPQTELKLTQVQLKTDKLTVTYTLVIHSAFKQAKDHGIDKAKKHQQNMRVFT